MNPNYKHRSVFPGLFKFNRLHLFLCLFTLMSWAVYSENPGQFIFKPDVRVFGADFTIGYGGLDLPLKDNSTILLSAGGGYEDHDFYRDPITNGIMNTVPDTGPFPGTKRTNFSWGTGLELTPRAWTLFLWYKGRFDLFAPAKNTTQATNALLSSAYVFPAVLNYLLPGLVYNTVTDIETDRTKKGTFAEFSCDIFPSFLANSFHEGHAITGPANGVRSNAKLKTFLPFARGLYGAAFLAVDYAVGRSLPLSVLQTFGGRDQRLGLGGAVRGIESGRFDTPFKIVNNLELRYVFPAIFPGIVEGIHPGLIVFFDTGYYYDQRTDDAGFLATTGLGISLDLFKVAAPTIYFDYVVHGNRTDGRPWLLFDIGFNFHF